MASLYLRLSATPGPLTPGNVTPPTGQPSGFSMNDVFKIDEWVTGVASPQGIFSTGGGGAAAAKVTADEVSVALQSTTGSPAIFQAAAQRTLQPRAALIVTSNATGGIATEWVQHYWLLRDAVLTSYRSIVGEPPGFSQISLSYTAAYEAFFATPSGGVLGARTQYGFDFLTQGTWNP